MRRIKHTPNKLRSFDSSDIRHSSLQKVSTFYIRKPEENAHRLPKLPTPPSRAAVHSFCFLTEGTIRVDIGGREYLLEKNTCTIIPAGQLFSIKEYANCKGFMGGFHNEFLLSVFGGSNLLKRFGFLHLWGNPVIVLENDAQANLDSIFNRIYSEFTDELNDDDIIRTYLMGILLEINKVYKNTFRGEFSSAEKINNLFQKLIFENLKLTKKVADYAAMLNITPNHLNKAVKKITGKSPSKWIEGALVAEAKILIFQTNLNISEIAAEVGVLDQSYFSRVFKKHEGITPIEFRKMIEKS